MGEGAKSLAMKQLVGVEPTQQEVADALMKDYGRPARANTRAPVAKVEVEPSVDTLVTTRCELGPDAGLLAHGQSFNSSLRMLNQKLWQQTLVDGGLPSVIDIKGLPFTLASTEHPEILCSGLATDAAKRFEHTHVTGNFECDVSICTIETWGGGAIERLLDPEALPGPSEEFIVFAATRNDLMLVETNDLETVAFAARKAAALDFQWGMTECISEAPLAWNGKTWATWKPPFEAKMVAAALKPFRDAVTKCQLTRSRALTNMLRVARRQTPKLPQLIDFEFSGTDTARLEVIAQKPQLLMKAELVEVAWGDGSVSHVAWAVLEKALKQRLQPFKVDGSRIEGLYLVTGLKNEDRDHLYRP